jgi:hypothetical protein
MGYILNDEVQALVDNIDRCLSVSDQMQNKKRGFSLAKAQRAQRKSLSLEFKPSDLAFLCELGGFARDAC